MKYWLNLITLHYLSKGTTYGYAIRKQAYQESGGLISMNGIETALTRMQRSGLVTRNDRVQNGHLVAFYSITETGRLQYQALRTAWNTSRIGIEDILNK